jgi:hypothetical protein
MQHLTTIAVIVAEKAIHLYVTYGPLFVQTLRNF